MYLILRANTKRLTGRSFHTPFAVLGNSPLTTPTITSQYEKQYDHPPEPTTSHSGYRTYVVSEPDASTKHYQVPAGAYPTSAPYTTDEPNTEGVQYTSTGGEQVAHGFTTQHYGGVGETFAPGEMGVRRGGMKLMDKGGTGQQTERTDGKVAEKGVEKVK